MTLNPSQRRFLDFHRRHCVTSWRWHWGQSQLRAQVDCSITTMTKETTLACVASATIWFADLEELLDYGLMITGHGCYHITKVGCAALLEMA